MTDKKEQSFVRQLDFYYLGLDRKTGQFDQGIAREQRHTLGVNAHETAGNFSLLQEGDLQFGTFGSGRLLGWKSAQGVSYTLPRVPYHPVLDLQGAISSGDKKPQNADLQTFYPLFPSGMYYGDMVFTSGSLNAIIAHSSLGLQLSKSISLDGESFFLWRQRTTDGLYSQSGMFMRTGQTSLSRYVGATQDLDIAWHVDEPPCDSWRHIMKLGHILAKHSPQERHNLSFGNSELQVLNNKRPAATKEWCGQPRGRSLTGLLRMAFVFSETFRSFTDLL